MLWKSESQLDHKNWHVITKTRNGTVSMIRNLTLKEAFKVSNTLNPVRPSGVYFSCESDIELLKVIGPEEWDGCSKAMKHLYQNKRIAVVDSGPNKGRSHTTDVCVLCRHHFFEWND